MFLIVFLQVERQVILVKDEYSQEIQKMQKKMDRLVKELHNLRSNNALQTSSKSIIEEEFTKLKYEMESVCE